MKKFYYLLMIVAVSICSCSKDDSTGNDPDPIELILIDAVVTRSGPNLSNVVSTFYIYDGNRIVTAYDSNGNFRDYTYAGNFISKIESYSGDGSLFSTETFFYDGTGKLSVTKRIGQTTGERNEYVHNADGTISISTFEGTQLVQDNPVSTSKLFFTNGEVSKSETYYTEFTSTHDYTYDDKLKPTKNILGFDLISYAVSRSRDRKGVLHNITSDVLTEDTPSTTVSRTYTYDANGFPLTILNESPLSFEDYQAEYTYKTVTLN